MFVRQPILLALLAQFYGSTFVSALPAEVVSDVPRPSDEVPCDPISKYTTKFFEDSFIYKPAKDQCLFYTRGLSIDAQTESAKTGAITIWSLFKCELYKPHIVPYDPSKDPTNPRRCIFTPDGVNEDGSPKQSADELTFFSNMSRAMARYCDGKATVMNEDPNHLKAGIWGTVEFPALQASGNPGGTVSEVNRANKELVFQERLWTRSTSHINTRDNISNETSPIMKRTVPTGKPKVPCFTPEQIGDIDLTPW